MRQFMRNALSSRCLLSGEWARSVSNCQQGEKSENDVKERVRTVREKE